MSNSGGTPAYWFDARPLVERKKESPPRPRVDSFKAEWSGERSVKGRLSALRNADVKGMARDWLSIRAPRALEAFAEANGMTYVRQTLRNGRARRDLPDLPARWLGGAPYEDVLSWRGRPYVEFGQYLPPEGNLWGYVALRHDLRLPRVVVDTRANDPRPSSFSKGTQWALDVIEPRGTTLHKSGHEGLVAAGLRPLDLGAEDTARFRAYSDPGGEQAAAALLTAPAVDLVRTTAATFDIEILDSWLVLYGYGYYVATTDPDRWAWIFALTSRWLDQCAAWAASWPAADTPAGPSGPAPAWRDAPFHTERTWPTPRQLVDSLPRPSGDLAAVDRALWGRNNDGGLLG